MRTADPVKDPSAEVDDLRVPGCAIAATTKRAESAICAKCHHLMTIWFVTLRHLRGIVSLPIDGYDSALPFPREAFSAAQEGCKELGHAQRLIRTSTGIHPGAPPTQAFLMRCGSLIAQPTARTLQSDLAPKQQDAEHAAFYTQVDPWTVRGDDRLRLCHRPARAAQVRARLFG